MNIKLLNIITNIMLCNNLLKNNICIQKKILKNNIVFPKLYNINDKSSLEHIYPKSLLLKKDVNDIHNIYCASKKINNIRSNYIFSDETKINWIKINNDNFICHHNKLFNPNNNDKGIISRALLYMTFKHKYKLYINKNTLYKWCINYQPDIKEQLHNIYGLQILGYDNPFITKFYDKNYNQFIVNFLNNF